MAEMKKKSIANPRSAVTEALRGSFPAGRRFHGTLFPVFIDEGL